MSKQFSFLFNSNMWHSIWMKLRGRSEGRKKKEEEAEIVGRVASRQETGILNGKTLTRGNEHSAIRLALSGIVHIKSVLFECQKYPGTGDSVSGWIGTRETKEEIRWQRGMWGGGGGLVSKRTE